MIIRTEYRRETTHYEYGDITEEYVVMPEGLPGKHGAAIVLVNNLKYFLEMFTTNNTNWYLTPYEILAKLEERVREDMLGGEIQSCYLISYQRDPKYDGEVIFEFSCFEVNSETEPDENYRSLYINFEYTGSAS